MPELFIQFSKPNKRRHSCFHNIQSGHFQKVCGDYFKLKGHSYQWFSGWVCIHYFKNGTATAKNLITNCRRLLMNYAATE